MKKIYALMAAMVFAAGTFAASYGILVNGQTYFPGTETGEFEGFKQYLAHVQVKAGDFCQLCDAEKAAVWAVKLNSASSAGFTYDETNKRYNITVTGCYDFYIKLKYEADELYIGPGSDCGEGIDITTIGDDDDINYYAIGWINGADAGEAAYDVYDDNYLFVDGKLTIDCKMGSYIAIKDHKGNFYYSKTETTIANTTATMDWANGWSPCQKWAIPEGVNYIIMRSAKFRGQIQLERVDKATYDAYNGGQAIENTPVSDKARKVIIDGQLRILRGNRMFDATGREL